MAKKATIAVFISGSGTNMAALIYAAKAKDCPFEVVLVASNNPDAPGLAIAEAEGVSIEEAAAKENASIPLGRPAEPSEIASAICFLAGPDSSYITGIVLPVAGGMAPGI